MFLNHYEEIEYEEMTVNYLLDVLFEKPDTKKKYYMIQQKITGNNSRIPELQDEVFSPDFAESMSLSSVNLWIGAGGQHTYLHLDATENIMVLLSGEKHFGIYPVTDTQYLYPVAHSPRSATTTKVNTTHPDLVNFPLFSFASPTTVKLVAGDLFYLPAYWWHEVRSYGRNIGVNFWYKTHSTPFSNLAKFIISNIIQQQHHIPSQTRKKSIRHNSNNKHTEL